jgi:hypothetical protein
LEERQDLSALSDSGYAVLQDEWVVMATDYSAWIELGTCSGTGSCGANAYGTWFYQYGYQGVGHLVYHQPIGDWNQWHYFDFYYYQGYWYPYVDSTCISLRQRRVLVLEPVGLPGPGGAGDLRRRVVPRLW